MEKINQILESLYDRVIEPMEAKQQLLDLFAVSNAVCECVYEYNDDHHGICVWQCPKCEAEENEQTDC